MKIEKIFVSNYKSYDVEGVTIPISDITGFIGANSVGKSNVLRALDVFFHPVKLNKSDFYLQNTEKNIVIDVTFSDCEKNDLVKFFMLIKDSKITLRRIYKWNESKEQAESEKSILTGARWFYVGEISELDPFPDNKLSASDIKKFLSSERGQEVFAGKQVDPANFQKFVIEYWDKIGVGSETWLENFEWKVCEEIETNKNIIELVSNLSLPEYIYLPTDQSYSDEFSLKKGTRFEDVFTTLMQLTEKEAIRKNKKIDKIKSDIDKLYKGFYDNRLDELNRKLNDSKINWNFSNSQINIKRDAHSIDSILQPPLKITSNDGFETELGSKGMGSQRLAIFQFLQIYSDIIRKRSNHHSVILAIEEPELYLHPAYKRALYKLIRKLKKTFQTLYTTHDPIFVRLEYFDEIRIIRKGDKQNSFVNYVDWETVSNSNIGVKLFEKKTTSDSKRQELFNKCHGEQNEGFFADKIILVEGNTEIYALPIYLEKFDFCLDTNNISIISSSGVDSIISMYYIFTSFGIPVYIIYDGDKPCDELYAKYSKVAKIGKKRYENFLTSIEIYIKNKSLDEFEIINKLNEKYKLLKSVNDLKNKEELEDIDELISLKQYEEISKKASRNRRFLNLFNEGDTEVFSGTIISSKYAKWERNFEEDVSKKLLDYDIISNMVPDDISGKPLIAKSIASLSNKDNYGDEFENIIGELKKNIINLSTDSVCIVMNDTENKVLHEPKITTTPYWEEGKNYYKVFTCVAGPINPEADEPIEYAYGDVPEGTSYIVKINGDSMEPIIPNHSYLAVKKITEYQPNKIYIFYFDGDSICKQYIKDKDGNVRLISLNGKYAPIMVSGEKVLNCNGMVICGKDKKPIILKMDG